MPTLDDLREVFADLEAAAPHNVEPTRLAPRRSRVPALLAAAVVVAIAVVGALLSTRPQERSHGPLATVGPSTTSPTSADGRAPSGWLTHTFTVDPIAGATTIDTAVDGDHQSAHIRLGTTTVWLSLYRAGGDTPTRPSGANDVTVNGHAGFLGRVPATLPGMVQVKDGPEFLSVAWQYAPAAWAVAQAVAVKTGDGAEQVLRVARAVHPGPTRALRVPIRIGRLPSGYRYVGAELSSPTPTFADLHFTATHRIGFTISVDTDGGAYGAGPAGRAVRGRPITVDAWSGRYDARCGSLWLTRDDDDLSVSTEPYLDANTCRPRGGATVPTRAELVMIVRGVTLASDPADPRTWFAVSDAVPHNR